MRKSPISLSETSVAGGGVAVASSTSDTDVVAGDTDDLAGRGFGKKSNMPRT